MPPTPPGTRIRDLSQRIQHAWDALNGRVFSPGEPQQPTNPEPEPRRFDYSVSRNTIVTPRTEEPAAQLTAFEQLRALCNAYDIASLCIKHLTERAQLVPWSIVAKDPEQQTALQSRCDEVRAFFEYPDKLDDWTSWLARALNNVLVLDALPIYLRPTRNGGVYALEVVDGATIKPIIDQRGRVLGFQQVVKGLPMSQYQRAGVDAPDERMEGFGDAGRMLYAVRYPRPDGVYGRPPIERVLIAANTALRQQHFQLAHFSEGNIPAGVIEMPASMTAQQVQTFLEDFDAVLAGNAAARSKIAGIPPGGKLTLLKPFQYDTAIPEWLMKTTCAAFGVPPSVLGGYTADVNRATADSQDHQGNQGVRSLLEWFRGRVLNTVIGRELGYPELELKFLWGDETDRLQQAQTLKLYVEMGALTPEQALRDAYGDTYEYMGETEPELPDEDTDEWLKMDAAADEWSDDEDEIDGFITKRKGGWDESRVKRDARGRFAGSEGSGKRKAERDELKANHAAERSERKSRHDKEKAALRERQARERSQARGRAQRSELAARHQQEREQQRQQHARDREQTRRTQQLERDSVSIRQQAERQREADAAERERRENNPKAQTTAYSQNNPIKTYQMRHRLVDMADVKASNTLNGAINPDYDPALQPRDRSRASSRAQIDDVARNMNTDVMTVDTHQIDRGSPIVDRNGNVLSGNGRTLALQQVYGNHPDKADDYRASVRAQLRSLGIPESEMRGMERPMLVRELADDTVDPASFAREANSSGTLRMSPMEQAKVDGKQVNERMMRQLVVRDGMDIDKALKSRENEAFVQSFLATVPDNERANLLTRDGRLNQMGLYRIKAAVYTNTFAGDAGERMAESLLESTDPDLKNIQNGITGALPAVARAEHQSRSGERNPDLALGQDIAIVTDTLARIRDNPTFTDNVPADQVVQNYIDNYMRNSMFAGTDYSTNLTDDQVRLLTHLDSIRNSPKKVRTFLEDYAKMVDRSSNPNQAAFGDVALTRGEMLDRLISGDTAPAVQGGMF